MQDKIDYSESLSPKNLPLSESDIELNQGQSIFKELKRILIAMGIKAEVYYKEGEDEISLEIRGSNLGAVIGKRGQTLEALEFILNVIHKKHFPDAKNLVLDIEGYREKKVLMLRKMLSNARETVLSTRNEVPLEPMSPSERKMIHLMCRDLSGVVSESHGEGISRRVVIKPIENGNDNKSTIH